MNPLDFLSQQTFRFGADVILGKLPAAAAWLARAFATDGSLSRNEIEIEEVTRLMKRRILAELLRMAADDRSQNTPFGYATRLAYPKRASITVHPDGCVFADLFDGWGPKRWEFTPEGHLVKPRNRLQPLPENAAP